MEAARITTIPAIAPDAPATVPVVKKRIYVKVLERISSSVLGRYGLSLGLFAVLIGISASLSYLDFRISLTILILIGLVVTAWYGGLGPGVLMAALIVGATVLTQPKAPDASLAKYVFGHFSNFSLIVFIVWLIHSRKLVETKLVDKGTELQRLNDTLERRVTERTVELQAANRDLESFSYSVSHDLRGPVRAIDGFSGALLEDYEDTLDEDGKGYLRHLRSEAVRMNHLIDDMLQLATVTKSELERSEVDLSRIAHEIIAELQRQDPERSVTHDIEENVTAYADERLVRVALRNLIGNSWKFTSKAGEAKIEFGKLETGGRVEYFVRDNGVGFEMTYADKLFRPFERLHSGNEFDGTGIGLATVQRVIQKHGGEVRGEGSVGKGAVFSFTL